MLANTTIQLATSAATPAQTPEISAVSATDGNLFAALLSAATPALTAQPATALDAGLPPPGKGLPVMRVVDPAIAPPIVLQPELSVQLASVLPAATQTPSVAPQAGLAVVQAAPQLPQVVTSVTAPLAPVLATTPPIAPETTQPHSTAEPESRTGTSVEPTAETAVEPSIEADSEADSDTNPTAVPSAATEQAPAPGPQLATATLPLPVATPIADRPAETVAAPASLNQSRTQAAPDQSATATLIDVQTPVLPSANALPLAVPNALMPQVQQPVIPTTAAQSQTVTVTPVSKPAVQPPLQPADKLASKPDVLPPLSPAKKAAPKLVMPQVLDHAAKAPPKPELHLASKPVGQPAAQPPLHTQAYERARVQFQAPVQPLIPPPTGALPMTLPEPVVPTVVQLVAAAPVQTTLTTVSANAPVQESLPVVAAHPTQFALNTPAKLPDMVTIEAALKPAPVAVGAPVATLAVAAPTRSVLSVPELRKSLEPLPAAMPGAARRQLAVTVDALLPATPSAAPLSFSAPAADATAGPLLTSASPRPLDFAALVDRIEAARDAGSSGAVSVAIRHQDFGPVSLRFETNVGGLAVDLRSADPEFAQAVSGALAAQNEAPRGETNARGDTGTRSDANARGSEQNSARQDMNGQARNSSGSRHGESSRSAAPQPSAKRDSASAGSSELFA